MIIRISHGHARSADETTPYKGQFTDRGKSLRTAPLFETGDERYTWLNSIQAVGIGTVNDDQTEVSYEVYALC